MKLQHLVIAVVTLAFGALTVQAGPKAELPVKAGDTIYVCGCGEKCACEVAAKKAGKCSCGHELAKVTVSKVEGKKAHYTAAGKDRSVKTEGKFACDCGADCCQMISQKAGKCQCGKELAKVEKAT